MPLIEGDDPFGEATVAAVRDYAAPLKAAGVDTVILGCTHYPLIRPIFQRVFGRDVTLVFSAEETAREVAETLARKGIEHDPGREGSYRFLTTGDPTHFRTMGQRFLQLPIGEVEHVDAGRARGGGGMTRADGRQPDQLRPLEIAARLARAAARRRRSTRRARRKVLCTATVEESVPRWLQRSGRGWMTAEYSLLPASTGERTQRGGARAASRAGARSRSSG